MFKSVMRGRPLRSFYGVWFRNGCTHSRSKKMSSSRLRVPAACRIGSTSISDNPKLHTHHSPVGQQHSSVTGGRIFPCAVVVWIGQSGEKPRHSQRDRRPVSTHRQSRAGMRWGYGDHSARQYTRSPINHVVIHLGGAAQRTWAGIYTLGPFGAPSFARQTYLHHIDPTPTGGWASTPYEGSRAQSCSKTNWVYEVKSGGFHQTLRKQ